MSTRETNPALALICLIGTNNILLSPLPASKCLLIAGLIELLAKYGLWQKQGYIHRNTSKTTRSLKKNIYITVIIHVAVCLWLAMVVWI